MKAPANVAPTSTSGRWAAGGSLSSPGIDEVEQNDEVVLVNGKVKTFTIRLTPQTIEKLNAVNPPPP